MELSKQKAKAVAEKVEEGIIISADTIGYMNNEKFEKPKSREEAFRNIKKFYKKYNKKRGLKIIFKPLYFLFNNYYFTTTF